MRKQKKCKRKWAGGEGNVKEAIMSWKIFFYVFELGGGGRFAAAIGRRGSDKLVTASHLRRLILKRIKVHPIS
jgi:hypothetical protein